MRLTSVGHACVLLEFAKTRVLTDPFSPEIGGYAPVDVEADVVTLSHSNPKWHSYLDDVQGEFQCYKGLNHFGETVQVQGLQLEALRVFENLYPGRSETEAEGGEGPNAMIKITGDGVRVLHMGDVGHALSPATLKACGKVDVLLPPTGGAPTIDLNDLLSFVAALRPRLVVPIHYAVPGLTMSLLPIEALAQQWNLGEVVRHTTSTLDVTSALSAGTKTPQLHLLSPLRLASSEFSSIKEAMKEQGHSRT